MGTLLEDKNAPQSKRSPFPKPLKETVETNKRVYRLVQRVGQAAIYSAQVSPFAPQATMYEVIMIRVERSKVLPSGTVLPFREVYPSLRDWGKYGITYTANSHRAPLQAARAKL